MRALSLGLPLPLHHHPSPLNPKQLFEQLLRANPLRRNLRRAAAPPKKSKMGSIGSLANSLLVFGHVLKGSVGEAFLQTLAITQKFQVGSWTGAVEGQGPGGAGRDRDGQGRGDAEAGRGRAGQGRW